MSSMDWLLRLLGILCVGLAVVDVYLTVLFPRSGVGLLSSRLHTAWWRILRLIAGGSTFLRRNLLPHAGPLLLMMDMLVWSSLLLGGFALIVWPELGSGIQSSGKEPTPQDFGAALYYAGYSLTTLGTGDLVPTTGTMRLLMVAQAGLGFSVLTLSLTYFMSVYSALARRNRFALSLHHQASGGDAIRLLSGLMQGSDSATQREFSDINTNLNDLYESHHLYSIVHYFYLPEAHYSMARMLFLSLDSVSLVCTALDSQEFQRLTRTASVEGVWRSGRHILEDLSQSFLPTSWRTDTSADDEERMAWKSHYQHAVETLQQSGMKTTPDVEAGWQRYQELRAQWNGLTHSFCEYMAHDWQDIVRTNHN